MYFWIKDVKIYQEMFLTYDEVIAEYQLAFI